jgi:hypothetical protein
MNSPGKAREVGTLIVVVLKGVSARERSRGFFSVALTLPARKTSQISGLSGSKCLRISHLRSRSDNRLCSLIHRQDPYCALQVGKELRRTKPLKRGGQHPEWDEEVRFPIVEDTEDILVRTGNGEDNVPPPVPSKEPDEPKFNKKRKMRLSCYADDPREPELIGDITINLEDVLTKGETDGVSKCSNVRSCILHSCFTITEWYSLTNKERYCGEIYLEMTFWSNVS